MDNGDPYQAAANEWNPFGFEAFGDGSTQPAAAYDTNNTVYTAHGEQPAVQDHGNDHEVTPVTTRHQAQELPSEEQQQAVQVEENGVSQTQETAHHNGGEGDAGHPGNKRGDKDSNGEEGNNGDDGDENSSNDSSDQNGDDEQYRADLAALEGIERFEVENVDTLMSKEYMDEVFKLFDPVVPYIKSPDHEVRIAWFNAIGESLTPSTCSLLDSALLTSGPSQITSSTSPAKIW